MHSNCNGMNQCRSSRCKTHSKQMCMLFQLQEPTKSTSLYFWIQALNFYSLSNHYLTSSLNHCDSDSYERRSDYPKSQLAEDACFTVRKLQPFESPGCFLIVFVNFWIFIESISPPVKGVLRHQRTHCSLFWELDSS